MSLGAVTSVAPEEALGLEVGWAPGLEAVGPVPVPGLAVGLAVEEPGAVGWAVDGRRRGAAG